MRGKVLVVDDDSTYRSELCEYLNGYDVIEASNGEDALRILKRANEIGVVLLDMKMPGLSGIDVLTDIKRSDPDLHVIISTGYSSKDMIVDSLKAHADDFLEKPVDPKELTQVIEEALGKADYGAKEPEYADIESKIDKVKNFVLRNCCKKTMLEDAARSVCLSPKYLSRIFKQRSGQSFSQFRIRTKIDKAKEFLSKGDINVNQISDRLAYENAESFIRQFKKLTGKTPTKYRSLIAQKKSKRF